MATQYIIDINHNDELPVVIRKCNENFRALLSQRLKQGQIKDADVYTEINNVYNDLNNQIIIEAGERAAADNEIIDMIHNMNSVMLFDDDANTARTIQLSDTAANYKMLQIIAKDNDGKYTSVDVYEPDGKEFVLTSGTTENSVNLWYKSSSWSISGNKITYVNSAEHGEVNEMTNYDGDSYNRPLVLITQVIGYKEANNIIVPGQDPGGTGDKTYTYTQSTPSDTWVIMHGMDKYPSIMVEDSAHNDVVGEYTYDNVNQVTLVFNGAFSGWAYLN